MALVLYRKMLGTKRLDSFLQFLLLFLTLSVLVANLKKLLYTMANFRSWFVEQGKENKIESLATPPPPDAARS